MTSNMINPLTHWSDWHLISPYNIAPRFTVILIQSCLDTKSFRYKVVSIQVEVDSALQLHKMALLGAAVSCFCCFGLFQVAKNSSFRSHHICETGYCNYVERLSCLINQVEFQLICGLENNKSPHISKMKTNTLILNFSRVYFCIETSIQYKLKSSVCIKSTLHV